MHQLWSNHNLFNMRFKTLLFLILIFAAPLYGQQFQDTLHARVVKTLKELKTFVALHNDATKPNDIEKNLQWLTRRFNDLGLNTTLLQTPTVPSFFAATPQRDGVPTVLFYMHLDGQAVDPSKWQQNNPYEMVFKKPLGDGWEVSTISGFQENPNLPWRVFGRSVSDDKGPIVMFINALEWMQQEKKSLPFNIKVILDGEEEQGSPSLKNLVKQYKDLLEADVLIINDGPVHDSGLPTLAYGARGITDLTLTAYGPAKPQHSGHYGNYAPNPAFILARALNSLKDAEGRVLLKGYYDGISIDSTVQAQLKAVPFDTETMHQRLGFSVPDKVGNSYQEALQYPSLNIRGMQSAWVGKSARTIVPDKAVAELDLRLVPETDGEKLQNLVYEHLKTQGFYLTDKEPTDVERQQHANIIRFERGGVMPAFRTDINTPYTNWLANSFQAAGYDKLIKIRIMGGTVPISPFVNELNIPAILMPLVNPDNNQHSPNENLKVENVYFGLNVLYHLLQTSIN